MFQIVGKQTGKGLNRLGADSKSNPPPEQFYRGPFHQQEYHSSDYCIVTPATLSHSFGT